MPIKYGALLPHSPILIPTIGKKNTKILQKTTEAYNKVISKIKEKEISTIIIISPHGEKQINKVSINESLNYNIKFAQFGDLSSQLKLESDLKLAQKIKDNENLEEFFSFYNQTDLDYGSGIIAYLIASKIPNLTFLTLNSSEETLENHYNIGKQLSPLLKKYEKNMAIIASGDMSHCLSKNSPGRYSPKGAQFDNQIKIILHKQKNIDKDILSLNNNLIEKANECGLRPLMFTLGILSEYDFNNQILAYQDDLGIGYLSAEFNNLQEK
jgi:AmmeMemoRadiSam system protein B